MVKFHSNSQCDWLSFSRSSSRNLVSSLCLKFAKMNALLQYNFCSCCILFSFCALKLFLFLNLELFSSYVASLQALFLHFSSCISICYLWTHFVSCHEEVFNFEKCFILTHSALRPFHLLSLDSSHRTLSLTLRRDPRRSLWRWEDRMASTSVGYHRHPATLPGRREPGPTAGVSPMSNHCIGMAVKDATVDWRADSFRRSHRLGIDTSRWNVAEAA